MVEMQAEFTLETHSSWVVPRTSSSQRCGSSATAAAVAVVVAGGGDMLEKMETFLLEKDTFLEDCGDNTNLLLVAKAEIRRTAVENLEVIMELKTMVLAIVDNCRSVITSFITSNLCIH